MVNLLSSSSTFLSNVRALSCEFRMIESYQFQSLCVFQVPVEPQVASHASLYHQVALVVLPWLLPGSEFLAHELLSTIVFSKDFIS